MRRSAKPNCNLFIMADFEIVREAADGFSHQGHTVVYTDAYIKLRCSFLDEALRTLKGSPLSVFFAVSLSLNPPDVETICQRTGYHEWSVGKALDYLISHRFIEELKRVGPNGNKVYRPLRYAWSGSDKNAPSETRNGKITIRREPFARHDDMNDDLLNHDHEGSFIHETRKIFAESGIEGKNLDLLARAVSPETAQAWADWLRAVNRTLWTRPEGYCVKKLLENSNAQPPYVKKVARASTPRRPVISGKLAPLFNPDPQTAEDDE